MVFRLDEIEVPAAWSQVAVDVLAQKYFRKAGVPARLKPRRARRACRLAGAPGAPTTRPLPSCRRTSAFGGETDAKQVFDRLAGTWTYWGWKGGYFDTEEDARAFFDELRYMLAKPDGGAELAAVVQHRPALGLRHRRPGAGPLLRRRGDRRGDAPRPRLRAAAAPRLLHPEHQRRSRQRRRDHGSLGARGAAVQVRLRHRHQLLGAARRERAAVRRRQVVGPDELPQDRRPRGRRDQVGRHHAARRQDGDRRHRSSRHRGVHQLEGGRGAEGRGAGRRLQAAASSTLNAVMRPATSPRLDGDDRFDPKRNRRAAGRRCARRAGRCCRRAPSSRSILLRAARATPSIDFPTYDTDWDSEAYLTVSGQNSNNSVRVTNEFLRAVAEDRRLGADPAAPTARSPRRCQGAASCGTRSPSPPGPAPIRACSTTHHQRVAHLPERGADQRLQPVLGVHVPRRHGLQPRLART